MGSIRENVQKILSEIPQQVSLLAATKSQPLERVIEAINSGVRIIGENYVKEAELKFGKSGEKIRSMTELHMIGALQKRNVAKALRIFDVIQGVPSLEVAREISRRAKAPVRIFLEVNIASEPTKSGFKPEEAKKAALEISKLPNIILEGIMSMPQANSEQELRAYFRNAKLLFESIKKEIPSLKHLSMGMSQDYKIAVEEGSTMIRVGTAIFGERNKK
ncbi:MAG: YggS family pyridoxal phosphate-dependent enzyme [Candidatus Woesearchaeota archaeon]